jgi:hypothetical protein
MTCGKYFNKGVKALDAADIGHVVRETPEAQSWLHAWR